MISDSPHQPLYLASDIAQAPEDDEFWPLPHDRMVSHNGADDHGQEIDERLFADLEGYDHGVCDGDEASLPPPPKPASGGSWLQDFASLYDALATKNDGDAAAALPDLLRIVGCDSETETESDDDSFSSSSKKGVSFSSTVEVNTIPHRSSLSKSQKRRMYASSSEIRRNKKRNRKEFRYDGCDWRNATEEKDMGVCQVTGVLFHPAHDLSWDH